VKQILLADEIRVISPSIGCSNALRIYVVTLLLHKKVFFLQKTAGVFPPQKIETSFCAIFLSTVNGVYVELAD